MSGLARRVAERMLSAVARLLPRHMSSWSRAMAHELVEIPDDHAALLFAAGCLRAAVSIAAAERLGALRAFLFPPPPPPRSPMAMKRISPQPRLLGLICGSAAVGMGIAYMEAAGAPPRYLLVNLMALVLGGTAWLALGRTWNSRLSGAGPAVLALSVALLLTALFGASADGVSRWVYLGPLALQVSLVVLPVMAVLYARRPDSAGTAGMVVAALALALQPDRAMAAVLAVSLLAVAFEARSRLSILAATASILAFGWTLILPDSLPASAFADRILYTAFDVHPLAGAAVVAGSALLLAPALLAARGGGADRAAFLAFGGCWAAVVAAAALGNYPTPLVGYGGSAVLGYLLSAALLPGLVRETAAGASLPGAGAGAEGDPDRTMPELRAVHPA